MKKLNLVAIAVISATSTSAAANTTQDAQSVERIQVTGSKIKRFNLTSPTPITVISGVEMENAGINNVNDLLAELPQATVGLSPETTTNTIYASGLNTTDLRGLGAERTLVLVNGRRYVSGSVGSTAVDLNNIPVSMIERMEIATGGAAAVYGADAVAGVVNIITKKSFDGIEIDASTVRPEQSGGEQTNFSITGGIESGKLSFIASLNYSETQSYSKLSRDFYRNPVNSYANPANTSGKDGIPDRVILGKPTTLAYYSEGGDFFSKPGSFTDDHYNNHHWAFDANGNIKPFDYGLGRVENSSVASATPNNRYYTNAANLGDGIFSHGYKSYFQTPLERAMFSTYGTYEINDDHAATFDFTYSDSQATTESSPAFFSHTIRRDNAYIRDDMAKLMDDNNLQSVTLRQASEDLWGDRAYQQDRAVFRTSIGLEGNLNDNWGYSTYLQYGRIKQDTLWHGEVLTQNLTNAIDAVELNGQIVCAERDTKGNVIGEREGCVTFNPMGAHSASTAQLNYIATTATRDAKQDQFVVAATVDGFLFELPAGDVAAAFTVEHRRESADIQPDQAMQNGEIFGNSSLPMSAEIDVNEYSTEFSIPLLVDHFLATDLTFETAYRYMDYSVTGGDDAWKIALNWGITDDVRVRLNRSKSVRAPSLSDLYRPSSQTYSRGRADPCRADEIASSGSQYKNKVIANCQADNLSEGWMPTAQWLAGGSLPGYIQGNQGLKNETSNDYTIGLIYTPEFIEGLDLTLDYWSFEIDGAIKYFGRDSIELCYESASLDNPYCGNFVRDENTGDIINYYQRPINAASINKKGLDIETAYRTNIGNGDLVLKLTATYTEEDSENATGRIEDFRSDVGEEDSPRWKGRFNAIYSHNDSSYILTANYRHSTVGNNEWNIEDNNYNNIPSYTTFDLMYKTFLMDELQLRIGVNNILDQAPPRNPYSYDDGEFYDVKGRRLSLGAKYTF